jgi:predicted DNA-binding transcriptional regulator AlpA
MSPASSSDLPVLLSASQVAQRVGRSLKCLRQWVRKGWFPAPLCGGPRSRWAWPADVVEQWLAQHGNADSTTPPRLTDQARSKLLDIVLAAVPDGPHAEPIRKAVKAIFLHGTRFAETIPATSNESDPTSPRKADRVA